MPPKLDELDDALHLVKKCTITQIKSLLRAKRDDTDVRLSAESKEKLIQINLRDAVVAGAVSLESVFRLIQDSEENGDQKIWYFRIPPRLSEVLEFNTVGENIWGRGWEKQVAQFPSLRLKPEGFIIADFRRFDRKPADWTLKIYGHATIEESTGNKQPVVNGTFWREYKQTTLRSVLVVRRNGNDLLEVRVQRDSSKKRQEQWLNHIWATLRPVIGREQLGQLDLETVSAHLIDRYEANEQLYTFRDAGIHDEVNNIRTRHEAESDQGSLLASEKIMQQLKEAVEAGQPIKGLSVTWLSEKTSLERDLRVQLAESAKNEMLVLAHTSASDLDHVTDQIRRFLKA